MTPKNFLLTVVTLGGIFASGASLSAQTVSMALTSVTPQTNVQGHVGTANYSVTAGLLNFRVDSVSPTPLLPFPMNLSLFCTELAQTINLNETDASKRIFTIASADQASKNGPGSGFGANIPSTGIGSIRARNLEILYAQVFNQNYNPAALSNEEKVAFQLAVWELSHDSDFSLTATGAPSGYFNVSNQTMIRTQAQIWVTAVANLTGNTDAARMSLSVIHSGTVQDFLIPDAVITPIPEPATTAAILAGVTLGLVALRRRRSGSTV